MKRLPETVIALGVVSLCTDASSEMIYPLLPGFLVTLGAAGTFIGLIDGAGETIAAVLKLVSGYWADRVAHKKPLVLLGYGIASLVRPLVALATAPLHVLGIRSIDRVGKGIRSSPRDALLAQAAPPERRGAAFGFHRAMDHLGAFIGPLVAAALLRFTTTRTVFALAAIPAAAAMLALLIGVKEQAAPAKGAAAAALSGTGGVLPAGFWRYLVVLAVFTLGNSTDFFLLLRAADAGVSPVYIPLLWAAFHAVKSALSTPMGGLSDRLGRRRLIRTGWLVYAAVYLGFSFVDSAWQVWALVGVYGAYYALSEGAEKALVADLAPPEARGRAFGLYNGVLGLLLLPASVGFGVLWDHVGHGLPFAIGAGLAAVAAAGLSWVPEARTPAS